MGGVIEIRFTGVGLREVEKGRSVVEIIKTRGRFVGGAIEFRFEV